MDIRKSTLVLWVPKPGEKAAEDTARLQAAHRLCSHISAPPTGNTPEAPSPEGHAQEARRPTHPITFIGSQDSHIPKEGKGQKCTGPCVYPLGRMGTRHRK